MTTLTTELPLFTFTEFGGGEACGSPRLDLIEAEGEAVEVREDREASALAIEAIPLPGVQDEEERLTFGRVGVEVFEVELDEAHAIGLTGGRGDESFSFLERHFVLAFD